MSNLPLSLIIGLLLLGGTVAAQQPLVSIAKKAELAQLAQQLTVTYNNDQQKAISLAPQRQWTIRKKYRNGDVISLQRLTPLGFPLYYRTFSNVAAAATTRTNTVQPGGALGLNLSGSGSLLTNRLAIWDGGSVLTTHQEFAGKNITLRNPGAADNEHATHVAGTMIAKGVYAPARGMAYNATSLFSYDFDNDIAEIGTAALGLLLSNHSYGTLAGWNYDGDLSRWEWYGLPDDNEDYKFGFYDTDAQNLDRIASSAPYYLVVAAAGNSRGITGPAVGAEYYGYRSRTDRTMISKGPRPATISSNNGYDIVPGFANAKNILTVGAVNQLPFGPASKQDISVSFFSAFGPTDDGRIKPDICGDGDNLISASNASPTSYTTLSGTSMSTPNISGSLYLLQEYYAQKNGGNFMRAATLKGLACHTAFDAGETGPDYTYGWGLLDMQRAAQAITDNGTNSVISENVLAQGQTQTISVVASGRGVLAATICWTDPQGAPNADGTLNNRSIKLVNDLDIRIKDNTTTYSPWILNPLTPAAAAGKGDNIRDNIEQVYLENAVPGRTYTITISHKGALPSDGQAYSLIVTGVGGQSYCASSPLSGADSRIDNVTLSNINNTPAAGCTTYTDFTSQTAQLEPGRTYPLSVKAGTCGANFNKIVKVFIDWNGDGSFNNTDELVATSDVINTTDTYSTTITVPTNVIPGNTSLMRVVLAETANAAAVSACGSYNKGETQDYQVLFLQAAQDAGAIAVNGSTIGGACAGTSNITVRLKNFGTTAISNIPVNVTVTRNGGATASFTETYTGTINPAAEDDFIFNSTFNSVAGATYTLTATTNLATDPVVANNRAASTITISQVPVPANLQAAYCNDTERYLLTGNGDGQLFWYQNATGGFPIAAGQTAFTTVQPLNNTFYAGLNDFSGTVGPATKSFSTGNYGNQFTGNVTVNTKAPVIIRSARLYIGNSGRITFRVINSAGQVVSSSTINAVATRTTPASGTQPDDANDQGRVYNLNLLLPAADTYTISTSFSGNATLFRNNGGGAAYPYSIGNIFSIVKNDASSATAPADTAYYKNFYYYFYNMQVVSAGCASSARVPVTVTAPLITQNGTVLQSNFATGNQWYLNDEPIAGAIGQTYVPEVSGNYQLKNLLSTGCTVLSPVYTYIRSDAVTNNPTAINLSSFPVPASADLHVVFTAPSADNMTLTLTGSSGRQAYRRTETVQAGNYSTIINVSDLIPGTYILRVTLGQKAYTNKVIIVR